MSPRVISKKISKNNGQIQGKEFLKIKKDLIKIRKFVEKNFEFVGNKFPEKVRDIYYENKKKRIYMVQLILKKEKN